MNKAIIEKAVFQTFKESTDALDARRIPYVVGGGIAVWAYGRQRWTKDIDIFLYPQDAAKALDALADVGFQTEMTDHAWIYKAFKREVMIDIIFKSKGSILVDDEALRRGVDRKIDGISFRFMAPEDLIIRKIFSMIEERPDWYDGISVIEGLNGNLDWDYFVFRSRKDPGRVLSFLLYAESEYPRERMLIPFWVIRVLAEEVLRRPSQYSVA